MRLAIVGVRKFWTRTATFISLLVAVALVSLEFVLVGVSSRSATASTGIDQSTFNWLLSFPGAYDAVMSIAFEFIAIIGLIYICTVSGSEWSWGTLKVAVTRGSSRWRYTVATFASLAIVLFIGLLITYVAGLIAVVIGASIAGISLGNPADPDALAQVVVKLLRCWVALAGLTSLGFAVTMVAKSQMAGIGTIIGYFIASIFAPVIVPDVVKEALRYLPFSISADAVGLSGPPGVGVSSGAIDPNVALLVIIGWLVGCLAVACLSIERAEVSG